MPYFTFIPRYLELTFFDSNPIKISLPMGDAMDNLLTEMAQSMDAAPDLAAAEAALYPVLGKDATDAILSRAEPPGRFGRRAAGRLRPAPIRRR